MARTLRVVHRTGYRYAGPATASHNEVRMTPRTTREQFVRSTRLDISPPAWSHAYVDYWGTAVTAFGITEPHDRLDVVATSTVEVGDRSAVAPGVTWAGLAEPGLRDRLVEYLGTSDHTGVPEEVHRLAAGAVRSTAHPADAARAVLDLIRSRVDYVRGSTGVNTVAAAAWAAGAGVCQDIVHLGLGALRSVGIPARYVSGYVMPRADGAVGERQVGESHAWLQFWDGAWVGFDPTNATPASDLHVEVGVGRDYFDVAPLRGVYTGSRASELFVEVELTVLG